MDIKNSSVLDPRSLIAESKTQKSDKIQNSNPSLSATVPLGSIQKEKKDYQVQVSSQAKELSQAFDKAFHIAKNTNPIREDRVLELKKRIENGTYHVSANDIAESIVRDAIYENISYQD